MRIIKMLLKVAALAAVVGVAYKVYQSRSESDFMPAWDDDFDADTAFESLEPVQKSRV